MSVTKFTHGPWIINGDAIDSANGASISEAWLLNGMTQEEHRANSYLIAAAPDLYSACQLALNAFEKNHCMDWGLLEKALAKARGDS